MNSNSDQQLPGKTQVTQKSVGDNLAYSITNGLLVR